MAKCAICEKENMYGHHLSYSRSHVSRRANRVWKTNVKSVRIKTANGTKKTYVCTACLRAGKVERA
ncbi:MAG: 50S ribosomal protein L28 [Lachnospiraceae bacterium]|nr:50S ribosomal protein L28 [Lachnospiraceae bacterium]